jgi:hypothetical protein
MSFARWMELEFDGEGLKRSNAVQRRRKGSPTFNKHSHYDMVFKK